MRERLQSGGLLAVGNAVGAGVGVLEVGLESGLGCWGVGGSPRYGMQMLLLTCTLQS